ncbi:hypothetical protein LTR95_001761 [Oleoguttula sp. CCFEE 5521]
MAELEVVNGLFRVAGELDSFECSDAAWFEGNHRLSSNVPVTAERSLDHAPFRAAQYLQDHPRYAKTNEDNFNSQMKAFVTSKRADEEARTRDEAQVQAPRDRSLYQPFTETAEVRVPEVLPDLTDSIGIGTQPAKITASLDVALGHLRDLDHSIVLWIDQVCIDQSNLSEKESQIRLMGLIYKRARNTLIWLGEDPYVKAFQAVQDMADETQGLNRELLEDEKQLLRRPPPHKVQGYEAARAMLNNPWSQRTWTIQEVVLSASPYIMAGRSTCHSDDCIGYCGPLKDLGVFEAIASEARVHLDSHVQHARCSCLRWRLPSTCSLLDILVATRHAKVSNPQDKILGILGLSTEEILPDFSAPLAKIL